MRKEEEYQILEKIKGGDDSLFRELVDLYSPRVISVIRGVVGSEEDARELAQDVFVKAYFSIKKFRGDSAFSTWLFRIAYNISISHLRKKRFNFVNVETFKIPENYLQHDNEEEREFNETRYRMLEKIVDSLVPEDRFLLNLFYEQDKSIKDITIIMGLSESNVKVRLHRVKKRVSELAEKNMEVSYG